MKERIERQELIKQVVRENSVRTQGQLSELLARLGHSCTQATISRDISDLGLKKLASGVYVLAEDLHLQRMVRDLVEEVSRTGNLVLVKAQPGTAPGVAAALDGAGLKGLLGSVSGDDTVLVICDQDTAGEGLENKLEAYIK